MSGFVYLGTSDFAVAVLEGMRARGLEPSLVVTPPDRRRGRGRKESPAPVAAVAAEAGIAVLKTANVNDEESLATIAASGAKVAMVCAFGQIIREPLLSELEMLNVHPSLLPRWRGAAPIERAIMAGDEQTGVCIIELEAGLDSGPIASTRQEPIRPDDDYASLSERLAEIGGELAAEAVKAALTGTLELTPQSDSGVTYAEKIDREERRLDPARSADELDRQVRALTPHIGTYLDFGEEKGRLGVVAAAVAEQAPEGAEPGELSIVDSELVLACAEGALRLVRVQPPGSRPMAVADYLRGHEPPARVDADRG